MTFDRAGRKRDYMRNYMRDKRGDREFVAIDSEGVSFGDILHIGNDRGRCQRTVFWGASGVTSDRPLWLNGEPFCHSRDILNWLLALPVHFGGNPIFVWFGSSYDATQLFVELPYHKAWELQHGKPYSDRNDNHRGKMGRYVLWENFALSYIKQKCLKVALLKYPNRPRDPRTGKWEFSRTIVIYDVFGFFQTSFLKAAGSIPGSMLDDEKAIIEEGKKQRGEFELSQIEVMKRYTACELKVLARMMTALRDSLEQRDLKLSRWQGAGSIAAAMMQKQKSKLHFLPSVAADLPMEQQWAHHAFFGGRIETLKQGRFDRSLYAYDVRSAYPYHMSGLPSMQGGSFRYLEKCFRADVEKANVLSMFKIRFECEVENSPLRLNQIYGMNGPEFYPFPYRDQNGRITFPPKAFGIYMAEEVRAAFLWLDYYKAWYASRKKSPFDLPARIIIEEALIFEPARDACEAFIWLRDMYQERREIVARSKESGSYDLTEKVIKLGINSVYGKTAQSVGAGNGPPSTACPWFAAAITAGTRAQLIRAAISRPPSAIVAFQTDGIVSNAPLRVCEGSDLGDWEMKKIGGGRPSIFVQPGVYFYEEEKIISKHRGIKLDLLGVDDFGAWLDKFAVECWKLGQSEIAFPYRYYVTLGAATASEERWKFAGHWVDGSRELQLDNLGYKRSAPILIEDKKRRAIELVDTIPKPAYYHLQDRPEAEEFELPLSSPHRPDWLDEEFGQRQELDRLNEEIAFTNG